MTFNYTSHRAPRKVSLRRTCLLMFAYFALSLLLAGCHSKPAKVAAPVSNPPAPSPSLLDLGESHLNSGEYADAAESYEAYLRHNPDAADRDKALFRLALCYGLGEDGPDGYRKAQKQLTLLVTQFPRSPYKPQAEYMLSLQGEIDRLKVDMLEKESLLRERNEPPAEEKTAQTEDTDKAARQNNRAALRQKDKIIRDKEKEIQDKDELIRKLTEELERMKKIDLGRKPSRPPG